MGYMCSGAKQANKDKEFTRDFKKKDKNKYKIKSRIGEMADKHTQDTDENRDSAKCISLPNLGIYDTRIWDA